MGNVSIIVFFVNTIFFSFIFWILTISLKFFYVDKQSFFKQEYYECGFKSFTNITISISIQFLLISIFLILYDGEFLLLYPVYFNLYKSDIFIITILLIFIMLLYFSLIVDYVHNSLEWSL